MQTIEARSSRSAALGRAARDVETSVMLKVIVADDQPAMRALIAGRLRDAGYDVVEVGDGNGLLSLVKECILDEDNPREPDLIITDIRMPGRSGLQVLSLIRETDWGTPVIMMTAFGDRETHEEAYRMGAAQVFDKPLDIKELVATAIQLIGPPGGPNTEDLEEDDARESPLTAEEPLDE